MWSDVFGLETGWGDLIALALLVGCLWLYCLASCVSSFRRAVEVPDAVREIWRRYEQGDLTRWEFDRLRGTLDAVGRRAAASASGTADGAGWAGW